MKNYLIEISVGYFSVENTSIEIKAKSREEAERLALESADQHRADHYWNHCGDFDVNYQVEGFSEIK
ncbi:hypothetical protein [Francisella sp. SYW-9]|uniref:hypothetical protein n=1 Tax=Francisella sp. SYW-9 TaxID=2610888 RepID=UPI00123DB245|nr:hypothetical protein [Francisella sp. SYW-9]